MEPIVFITSNPGKLREVRRFFDGPLDHQDLDLMEIQSLDPTEIVTEKARQAYLAVGRPVIVEDVSFSIVSLGGLPGTFIKWFERCLDNDTLCRLADGKDRTCVARVTYGYCNGETVRHVESEMHGTLAKHPRGENSFGWGSIFIPEGMDRTYAELSDVEQEPIAMRKKALLKLSDMLLIGH